MGSERDRLNRSLKVSDHIIVPSAALYRAQARLDQAEAIIAAISAVCSRLAALLDRAPAARGEQALKIRRAWLRASA
jgi:multidrug resistance efflux pump